jgi:high mobility group protein B4
MLTDHFANKKHTAPAPARSEPTAAHSEKKAKPAHEEEPSSKSEPEARVKRPPGSFLLFCNEHRLAIRDAYPKMTVLEVSENLGRIWRSLPEEEKNPYI